MRILISALLVCGMASAQGNSTWRNPYPAHRIAGNLYYVGTEDLACYLIATPAGHILINTGLEDSTPLLRTSLQQVGLKLEDVKILLTMQAHFDHVAAMAEVKKLSGAQVYATEADAPILEDGGKSDPHFGKSFWFAPVKVDRRLRDGDVVALGGVSLRVVSTPGHSKGSVSYTMDVMDGSVKRSVAIANMGSVVMPLKGNAKYPNIAEDFARGFEKQKKLRPDIWVAGHASQFDMAAKHKAGSYVDPQGYQKAVLEYERKFRETLAAGR
jgi:metallo-beta-lactamase class B